AKSLRILSTEPADEIGILHFHDAAFARCLKTYMHFASAIEARSQAQALDWSLVLISQGIESTVVQRPEDGAWILQLEPGEVDRAQQSITAYERENTTIWRHELKWTGLLFDARSVA